MDRIEQLANQYSRSELIQALQLQVQRDQTPVTYQIPEHPEISTGEMGLEMRTFGLLCRAGLGGLSDILQVSAQELLSIRGFGKHCLADVEGAIGKLGYSLYPTDRRPLAWDLIQWVDRKFSKEELGRILRWDWQDIIVYRTVFKNACRLLVELRNSKDPEKDLLAGGFHP